MERSNQRKAFQCRASGVSHSEVCHNRGHSPQGDVSMPCVRRFTFGDQSHGQYFLRVLLRFNAVRPAFHIRRKTMINLVNVRNSFQCRASGVSHSESRCFYGVKLATQCVSMPCVRRFTFGATSMFEMGFTAVVRFNAVRPAFHIRRSRETLLRCVFSDPFQCRASGVSHSEIGTATWLRRKKRRFNAVRPAFHIRRRTTLTALTRSRTTFQCRASGVSHSEASIVNFRYGASRFNAVRPAFHIRS